jgi:nucleoside-diphosphate-sugar epimerase
MSQGEVLVTGAAGFVGSRLVSKLIEHNRRVIALDCFLPNLYSSEIKRARWREFNSPLITKLEFDLRTDDFSELKHFDISTIINQAALPGLASDWSNFAGYYECNLSALNRLLEFAKNLNLHSFIQASTSSVYGISAVGEEEQNLNPTSPYGVSKLAAEKLLLAYQTWFDVPVKILRYFSVYGPKQRPDMAYSKIIEALISGKTFTIFGDGEQRRSNTYIDDVVNATILAETKLPIGEVVNICGDETISLKESIELLENVSGKKLNVLYIEARNGDQKITSGANSKAKQILGWATSTNIRDGLSRQYAAHDSP